MQQLMVDQKTIFLQQTQRQQNSSLTDMPTYNGDRLKWTQFWDTLLIPNSPYPYVCIAEGNTEAMNADHILH